MTVTVPPVIALTPAQDKVLRVFAADGADNATIAQRIGIAPETVKSHLRAVLDATGYANRAALGIAYRTGEFRVNVGSYRNGRGQ